MIRHIVAHDQQQGIAKNGLQPWDLPGELSHFAELTKKHGGVMLMGRKTYEAIGHTLPDRHNFVLTSQAEVTGGATVVHDLDGFLATHPEVWIIGGAALYSQTLPFAEELYITEIESNFDCDQFYPAYHIAFHQTAKSPMHTENGTNYHFYTYTRNAQSRAL